MSEKARKKKTKASLASAGFPQTGKLGCVNYKVIKSSCFQEAVSFNGGEIMITIPQLLIRKAAQILSGKARC